MPETPGEATPPNRDGTADGPARSPDDPNALGTADLEERWVLPAGAAGKPSTIYVYGDCRPVVNGVAFAMADMLDLTPLWVEVRDAVRDGDEVTAASAGWIPPDRFFLSQEGSGLEPNDGVANMALWTIVRSDEPSEHLAELTDFLRLPLLLQEMIGRWTPDSGPRAVVVANVERVKHLFPREPGEARRFLATILNHSASLVVTHMGEPGEGRFAFNAVFRVHASSFDSWSDGTLECEKGRARGPFSIGRPRRLGDIPSVARILTALRGTHP